MIENIIPLRIDKEKFLIENILYLSLFSLYNKAKFFFVIFPPFKLMSESVKAAIHKGSAVNIKL
jgi:hypothetical protein